MLAEPVHNTAFYELLGEDSVRFLNNYCTADLKAWNRIDPVESMMLDVKGRLIALMTLLPIANGVGLLCWGKPEVDLVAHLDRYIFKNDKSIRLVPNAKLFFIPAGEADDSGGTHPVTAIVGGIRESSVGYWQLESPLPGFFLLCTELNGAADRLEQLGLTLSEEANEFHRWRIHSRYPLVMQDTVEATLAQELGRDEVAISFTKGCYLGQETVARLDARGHVNWKLARVVLEQVVAKDFAADSRPIETVEVLDGELVIGQLTSVVAKNGLVRIRSSAASDKSKLFGLRSSNSDLIGSCRLV